MVESALGGGTQQEICESLAQDGTFCTKCLENLQAAKGQTLMRFNTDGDCGKCTDQCHLLVAPNKANSLSPEEVCGLCTVKDSLSPNKFKTVGEHYIQGLTPPGGSRPVPQVLYGWESAASASVNLTLSSSGTWPPNGDAMRVSIAHLMGVDIGRVHFHFPAFKGAASKWPSSSFFKPLTPAVVAFSVLKTSTSSTCTVDCVRPQTADKAIEALVAKFEKSTLDSTAFVIAGTLVSELDPDYSTCYQQRASCLPTVCDQCVSAKNQISQSAKVEVPCSSLFSGGPLKNEKGKKYDCAVRLAGGGDLVRSGRIEIRHSLLTPQWGTVCSSGWDNADANVFCRSIGYPAGGVAKTPADNCITTQVQVCDTPSTHSYINQTGYSTTGYDGTGSQCYYCLPPGGQYCSIKIVAMAGQFSGESSWQVDPQSNGPSGTFSGDYTTTQQNVDVFMMPGLKTVRITDTGGNGGWNPGWQSLSSHGMYGTCESFWKYNLFACRTCLAENNLQVDGDAYADYAFVCGWECQTYESYDGYGLAWDYGPSWEYDGNFEFGRTCNMLLDQVLGTNALSGSIKIIKRSCSSQTDASTCSDTTEVLMWESAAFTEYGQSSMDIQFQCGQDLNPADCTYGTCSCRLEDQTQCLPTYGAGTGPVWLSDVGCTGSETSLCECKQGSTNASVSWTAGLYSCNNDHKNDAGVECLGVQTLPPARIKDCDDVCVPKSRLGDGWCDDGQFDANFNCMQLSCDATSNVTGSTSDCHMKTCAPAPEQCPAGKWRCDDGSKCIDGAQ